MSAGAGPRDRRRPAPKVIRTGIVGADALSLARESPVHWQVALQPELLVVAFTEPLPSAVIPPDNV